MSALRDFQSGLLTRPESKRFTHDCSTCTYLGSAGDVDFYRCPQMGMPTIVGRYGSDGPEYTSGSFGFSINGIVVPPLSSKEVPHGDS